MVKTATPKRWTACAGVHSDRASLARDGQNLYHLRNRRPVGIESIEVLDAAATSELSGFIQQFRVAQYADVIGKVLQWVVEALTHHPRRGRTYMAGLPAENASAQFVFQRLFYRSFVPHPSNSPRLSYIETLPYRRRSIERFEKIISRFYSAEIASRNRNDLRVTDERRVAVAFGQRLAQLRTEREMAQEELADRAEVHRTAVANIERGTNVPRLDTVLKLASALGIPPCQLIDGLPEWQPPRRAPGRFEP